MNLHQVVAGAISAVNPFVIGQLKVSTGSIVQAGYHRGPTYQVFDNVPMQVQALTGREIEHLDALNIQGVVRSVYMNGNVEGLNRLAGKGGDILLIDGLTYLVSVVFETWDGAGWCKVGIALQVNS